jgi:hypothetical protein
MDVELAIKIGGVAGKGKQVLAAFGDGALEDDCSQEGSTDGIYAPHKAYLGADIVEPD